LLARLTIRVTVLAGFTVLAVAGLGLPLVGAATPLWLIAIILAGRWVFIGLVINPLLQALTEPAPNPSTPRPHPPHQPRRYHFRGGSGLGG
jgi:hypothetical protein